VLHPVPIIFKGSGFYVTDNRKSNNSGNSDKPHSQESPDLATAKED